MKFIYAEYNMYHNNVYITTFYRYIYCGLTVMQQKMNCELLPALNVR